MSRWFATHRQAWIKEALASAGHIRREDIKRQFGVSVAQASLDLRRFQEENPGLLSYNKTAKRYERVAA